MGSKLFANILHPDDIKIVAEHHARFANAPENATYEVEYRMKHAKGEWRWLQSCDTLFARTPEGIGSQILGTCEDITERKQMEAELRANEEKYRAYVENSPVAFFVVNSEGKYIQVNKSASNLLGYSINELRGMSIADILFEQDIAYGFKQFASLKETGKCLFEVALKRKDGQTVNVILNAANLPNGNFMAFCENITELKKAQETIEKERTQFENILDAAPVMIAYKSKDDHFVQVNSAFADFAGLPKEKIIGMTTFDVVKEKEVAQQGRNHDLQVMQTGVPVLNQTIKWSCKCSQKEIWALYSKLPFHDSEGNVIGTVSYVLDVDERKKTEDALKRSNAYQNEAQKLAHLGSWEWNIKTNQEDWSDELYRIFGFEPHSFQPTYETFLKALHPDDVQRVLDEANRASRGEKPYDIECRIVLPKGETRHLHCQGEIQRDSTGKAVRMLGTDLDVTELKKSEEKLEKSKKKYQFLFENNLDGIIVAKRDGRIVSGNPAICKMLSMNEQELLAAGRQGIVVNDQRNMAALKEQDDKGEVAANISLKRKDGSVFETEISSREFTDFDGSTSILVTVRDISNRLMLEDKLRTISSFTRHDIKNKLQSASGNLFLSKKIVSDKPEMKKYLNQIEANLASINRILDVSKDYELMGSQKLAPIDAGKAFENALYLFEDLKGIKTINKIGTCTVLADQMLTTLFYNLIDNSIKYGEKATQIEVHIQTNKDGSKNIIYQDNGVGISPETKTRLFDKGFGKGTGYGLFLIKKTCEIYGWTISEIGELGKGAKFEIKLNAPTIPSSEEYLGA